MEFGELYYFYTAYVGIFAMIELVFSNNGVPNANRITTVVTQTYLKNRAGESGETGTPGPDKCLFLKGGWEGSDAI